MASSLSAACSLADLYLAYRKAKVEAFYENTHFHALAFTRFEQDLHKNLRRLQERLRSSVSPWFTDTHFIGDFAYLPKSVSCEEWENEADSHFRALDPNADWLRRYEDSKRLATASFRLVIRPTVEFQVVSALWILKVGHLFDGMLDPRASFGNRLRRSRLYPQDPRADAPGPNMGAPGLFLPYFSAYRDWRENGLRAMEEGLERGGRVLAMTMDVEKFYHRVSPSFVLRKKFLDEIGLVLTPAETKFTKELLKAINTWYRTTPDFLERPEGALPVGLSASKILSNVILHTFDRAVLEHLQPLYYGRYVDDIFLVLRAEESEQTASAVIERLRKGLAPLLVRVSGNAPSLKLKLPYAKDSEIVFAGDKQKIFLLSSDHGLDLIHHIRDQIRLQSSEYRLLPSVPETSVAMASRALLATPDASLQVDALRKADVVSVRRLGFSLLLRDIETYAADLRSDTWRTLRLEFYGIVFRHVLTPIGFFQFMGYLPRVFGLMLVSGDLDDAHELVRRLSNVASLLAKTSTAKNKANQPRFNLCLEQYAAALLQAGIQASTAKDVQVSTAYLACLKGLRALNPLSTLPRSLSGLHNLRKQVLLADWGRRPYKDYWLLDQADHEPGPPVPKEMSIKRLLRLGAIRKFRESAVRVKKPYWPALAFPTRPLKIDEMGLVSPRVFEDESLYRTAIKGLRGANVATLSSIGFSPFEQEMPLFRVPDRPREKICVAVTSVGTTEKQWLSALRGKQDRSLERYVTFNSLLNRILQEDKRPDYIVLPELSVPMRWALRAARKLSTNGVSLLAGVEYHRDRGTGKIRNDCLLSLTTRWPGYQSSIVFLQPKFQPAHAEHANAKKVLRKKTVFFSPTRRPFQPPVFFHAGLFFSALVCSDLTNIVHRRDLRGHIDALFALEWNQDTKTFSALVESSANDLHAFIIQANNRKFGDCRIRAPASAEYERDIVQLKGGASDYYVLGEIDYLQLRKEQLKAPRKPVFKPAPIGYQMSQLRKTHFRVKRAHKKR